MSAAPPLTPALRDSRFLRACRREAVDATPVWLMRQAGRYMKEYRDVRARVPFKEMCTRPELAAEVTVTAARRIGADAAILFSDILLVLESMGARVDYEGGDGPQVAEGVSAAADVDRLRPADPEALACVYDAARQCRAALPPDVPLIGFCGAPFTLAAYLVEGRGAREALRTKILMWTDRGAWGALMDKLVDSLAPYLARQIAAGAQAVQIFDSWVGALSPADYREYVLPWSRRLVKSVPEGVPVIHFGLGTGLFLDALREAGGAVVGVDHRTDLDAAWAALGDVAVQGNLDPAALLADRNTVVNRARAVVAAAKGRRGHIFNLGHGILKETPVDNVVALVDAVHSMTRR
ncbi:MAG: uroporphyrinogen decarboxylase [Planctomycetes bacterium]|nr:uroporphyrinogen decarboxylase [Planctomycetota bacterium]